MRHKHQMHSCMAGVTLLVLSYVPIALADVRGNTSDANALADVSVTGRRAFAKFRMQQPQQSDVLLCLRSNATTQGMPAVTLQQAAAKALDRAYRVVALLRAGGWPVACSERTTLAPAYIAVSGEDDQPHRPVNVPSAEFPQYDLSVNVPRRNGSPLPVNCENEQARFSLSDPVLVPVLTTAPVAQGAQGNPDVKV